MSTLFVSLIAFVSIFNFNAQARVNDHDLSLPSASRILKPKHSGNLIKADRVEDGAALSGLSVQFVRLVKGVETPVEGLVFNAYRSNEHGFILDNRCKESTLSGTITLKSARYHVGNGVADYLVFVDVKCGTAQKVIFDETSNNGQPIAIWQQAVKAERKLSKEVGLKLWTRPIQFVWPATTDVYNDDLVNVIHGYAWDIVGHEIGHAIFDQANVGVIGTGAHKIDECFTENLAWSEGFATFFSAWINLDLNDANPHFEYLAARRGQVSVETVPTDVCGSPANEWRVTAFLWDLIDHHDDGETLAAPFAKLWKDSVGARALTLAALKQRLIQKGWDSGALQTIWKLNFPQESASLTR